MRQGAAAVLMVAVLLAGCAKAPAEDPTDGLVEAAPGLWLGPGKGALAVHVVSDAGLPLAQARVSVLGSDHFGRTDVRGAIVFINVTAGPVQVQVSYPNFQARTLDVQIPQQALVHLNLTLVPDSSVGAGYLPHEHDLWRGQQTYQMLDQSFRLGEGTGTLPDPYYAVINGYYRGINNASRWHVPLAEAPDGNRPIVLPGTKEMQVTLTWDDPTLDVLGICPFAPKSSQVDCLAPKASPATWTIEVRPSEADSGHARWSMWRLHLYHPPWTQTLTPSTTAGTIHVGIELTRGNIQVDPPHPDFWADGDEIVVHDDEDVDTSQCCSAHRGVRPESIIPPGTTRLRLEHQWQFRGAGAGPLDFDYQLLVRTGDMNPHTTRYSEYLQPTAIEGSGASFRKVYEMELTPEETDAYYQTSSTWFVVFWDQVLGKDDYHAQYRDTVHHLRIIAYR